MVGLEMTYDFTDILHAIETLNRFAEEKLNHQGLHFNKSHKKQMSIWNKLHQQTIEEGDVFSQYDSISTYIKL